MLDEKNSLVEDVVDTSQQLSLSKHSVHFSDDDFESDNDYQSEDDINQDIPTTTHLEPTCDDDDDVYIVKKSSFNTVGSNRSTTPSTVPPTQNQDIVPSTSKTISETTKQVREARARLANYIDNKPEIAMRLGLTHQKILGKQFTLERIESLIAEFEGMQDIGVFKSMIKTTVCTFAQLLEYTAVQSTIADKLKLWGYGSTFENHPRLDAVVTNLALKRASMVQGLITPELELALLYSETGLHVHNFHKQNNTKILNGTAVNGAQPNVNTAPTPQKNNTPTPHTNNTYMTNTRQQEIASNTPPTPTASNSNDPRASTNQAQNMPYNAIPQLPDNLKSIALL